MLDPTIEQIGKEDAQGALTSATMGGVADEKLHRGLSAAIEADNEFFRVMGFDREPTWFEARGETLFIRTKALAQGGPTVLVPDNAYVVAIVSQTLTSGEDAVLCEPSQGRGFVYRVSDGWGAVWWK